MTHNFDIEIAEEYGVDIAIVVNNIAFWIQKNKANNKHIHDGKVWTYNSTKAFSEIFPYWTENQMRRILTNMEEKGILQTGNYNQIQYDRTKWYTFTDAFLQTHKCICEFTQMDSCKQPNGFDETNEPIPDIKPVCKPVEKPDKNTMCGEQEKTDYTSIINHLNEQAGKNYKVTDSTSRLIHARIAEGFTFNDFFTVIEKKCTQWKGTDMDKYLRPSTLFNASKFEGYLNEFSKHEEEHNKFMEGLNPV